MNRDDVVLIQLLKPYADAKILLTVCSNIEVVQDQAYLIDLKYNKYPWSVRMNVKDDLHKEAQWLCPSDFASCLARKALCLFEIYEKTCQGKW